MLSTILLGATLIGFGIYVYKHPPVTSSSTLTPAPNTHGTKICMDYSDEDMNELDIDLVRDMICDYQEKQLRYINSAENMDDAYSIWFDLETLKKFIYHIEYETSINDGNINSKKLGLRIYYSRYPQEAWTQYSDLNDVSVDYAKHHTLVAIPTIEIKKGGKYVNADFNPLDVNTYTEGMPSTYTGTPTTNRIPTLPITGRSSSNSTTGSQNHGGLYPPHSNAGIVF